MVSSSLRIYWRRGVSWSGFTAHSTIERRTPTGDLREKEIRDKLHELMPKADVVISDMSPIYQVIIL